MGNSQITIGIRILSDICLKRLLPFAKEALKQGFRVVFLNILQSEEIDFIKIIGENRKITAEEISNQNDLDVLIVMDRCLTPPTGVKVVSVPHCHLPIDPENTDPAAYYSTLSFLAGSDYLFLGQKNLLNFEGDSFENLLAEVPADEQLVSKCATIIPGGYSSLDVVLEQISKDKDCCVDSVFFAQVELVNNFEDACNGANIIELLALKFPDKTIRYSPLPFYQGIQRSSFVMDMVTAQNVFFDLDYVSSSRYQRSELLVTDSSTMAYTFSNATLRPHIQCQLYGFKRKPKRTSSGWIVYSLDQLAQAIDHVQENQDEFMASIKKKRDESFVNLGNSAKYLIDNIEVIVKGESLSDWLCVERRAASTYEKLNDRMSLQVIDQLPTGYSKMGSYFCARKYFKTNESSNPFIQLNHLLLCARSFTRFNSFDLIHMVIDGDTLKYVDYSEYADYFVAEGTPPFFLCCDSDESIESYALPTNFIESKFAGYIMIDSNKRAGGKTLEDVFCTYDKFSIIIGNSDVRERFSIALRFYSLAIDKGCSLDLGPVSRGHVPLFIDENVSLVAPWDAEKRIGSGGEEKFLIWGCSGYFRELQRDNMLPDMDKCIGFIDNNSEIVGSTIDALPVYSLEQVVGLDLEPYYIFFAVSSMYLAEILTQIYDDCAAKNILPIDPATVLWTHGKPLP